jgi:hypothetical protein
MKNNLVWFTGAPGSKWSGTANILQSITSFDFNISDRSSEREYTHTGPTTLARSITHTGVYFGPGHGYGEDFHNINLLNPRVVEDTIAKEWTDPSYGRLLVKSHFFSHNLDYIAETWTDNPIIMILRPNIKCEQGWFGAGGWNIAYPNYRPYYKDDDTMKAMIAEHNDKIISFCNRKSIAIQPLTAEYLKRTFDWTIDQVEDEIQREWVHKHLIHTEGTADVSIAIWNIEKLQGKINAN